jgi:hypothetical protein
VVAVQKTEGADAMHAFGWHVLKETAQELVGGQGHGPRSMGAAIAVAEGDGAAAHGDDGLVGDGGAVDVAAEVIEHLVCALHHRLGEDDPALIPWDMREGDPGQCAAGEMEEGSAESLGERRHGHEVAFASAACRPPGSAVGGKTATRNQHVDVRVPLERSGPGVKDRQGADGAAHEARIGAQRGKGLKGGAEEQRQEYALVRAQQATELFGQGEDDVEAGHRQKEIALALEPPRGGVIATLVRNDNYFSPAATIGLPHRLMFLV